MSFDTLHFEIRNRVAHIGLNRPGKYNAFNLQMLRELSLAWKAADEDPDAWCMLLYAEGDHFTAGLDLAEVGPAVESGARLFPEEGLDPLGLYPPFRDTPVVCAVQGWCLTIGIELALACDIRVAAEGTRFSQLEIKRGIMPFGGATLRLPFEAGWGNAMRYLLTADEFGPDVALRLGLVQEVAPPGRHLELATELAERVARQAPLGVRATLRSARQAVRDGEAAAIEGLLPLARDLMHSEDAAEGLQSFIERRQAKFRGR